MGGDDWELLCCSLSLQVVPVCGSRGMFRGERPMSVRKEFIISKNRAALPSAANSAHDFTIESFISH